MTQALLDKSLDLMSSAVHGLAALVPPPRAMPFVDSFVYRHIEQLPQQAIVQKLARLASGLNAARALMNHGYFQEQAAVHRIVEEVGEDVIFLSMPLINGNWLPIHQEYLDAFFLEEYDPATGKPSSQDRPMVRRKKIRAYNAQANSGSSDPSGHIEAARVINKSNSGFVHAASPHIMDMFFGAPPRFHVLGMLGTQREVEFGQEIYNYFHRSSTSFYMAAYALRSRNYCECLLALSREIRAFMVAREH